MTYTGFCNPDLSADKTQPYSYPPYDFSKKIRKLQDGSKEHKIKIITLAHNNRTETMWTMNDFNSRAHEDLYCLINDHPNVVSGLVYDFESVSSEGDQWLLSHLSEQLINNFDSNNKKYKYVPFNYTDYEFYDSFAKFNDYDDYYNNNNNSTYLNVIYVNCFGTESACRSIGQRINCNCKNGTPVISSYHGSPIIENICPKERDMCAKCDGGYTGWSRVVDRSP